MYACKIGSLQARQNKSHLGSPQILHLWGERRQWSHQRFSGAVSFFANHLTNATLIYPAKCERTFGGPLLFLVGRTEGTTNFAYMQIKKRKSAQTGAFSFFNCQLSTVNCQLSISLVLRRRLPVRVSRGSSSWFFDLPRDPSAR